MTDLVELSDKRGKLFQRLHSMQKKANLSSSFHKYDVDILKLWSAFGRDGGRDYTYWFSGLRLIEYSN